MTDSPRSFDLRGRVALVTGAGQNVGAEIARLLAVHGASVAVNDLIAERATAVAEEIASTTGARTLGVAADVTDLESVHAMVRAIEASLGPVDILVNNAGVPPNPDWEMVPFGRTKPASWKTWVDINMYGVFHCCHATLGGMEERGYGRIVNIVSDAGRIGEPLFAVYAGAKAGAIGFSKSLAKEAASHGVTVNCVALGNVSGPSLPVDLAERLARQYPVGRVGRPADIAPAVLYFASTEAEWVTGQVLPVNGGYAT